jgi:hypothetical protein
MKRLAPDFARDYELGCSAALRDNAPASEFEFSK